MSISSRLSSYLAERGIQYEITAHHHSRSSAQTARTAHVLPGQLAKSVLLEDEAGCVMAVVPADRSVKLGELARLLGRHGLRLSDEERIAGLFDDCDRGAVPPVGMAWGIDTIVDEDVESNDVVYFEGGDHERLVCMSGEQFQQLMKDARHGRFSKASLH